MDEQILSEEWEDEDFDNDSIEPLTPAAVKFIIARVLDNANDAFKEAIVNGKDEFYQGRKLAYYEILDTIKSELMAHDQDLKEFGLDVNLEKMFS